LQICHSFELLACYLEIAKNPCCLKRQSTLHSHIAGGKQACNSKQVLSNNLKYDTLACYVLCEQASETGKNRKSETWMTGL